MSFEVEPSGALFEVAPLGQAGGAARGGPVASRAAAVVAGHLEQVRAHRGEAVVASHARVGVERCEEVEPGPRARATMATATAWLSVTIGFGAMRSSSS